MNKINEITESDVYEIAIRLAAGRWGGALNNPSAVAGVVAELPLSDMDVAAFMADIFGERIHYNGAQGWFEWDGTVHQRDYTDTLGIALATRFSRALSKVTDAVRSEIARWSDQTDRERGMKFLAPALTYLERTKNNAGMRGLTSVLRDVFTVDNNYFDRDHMWAVMRDGRVIHLAKSIGFERLIIEEPSPARPVTRKLGVSVEEGVTGRPERFLRYLRATVSSDEEITYLQTAAGAALLGEGTAKNIPHLVGPPHTFKSVYLATLDQVFGDYAGTLPATALVARYGGGTNFAQSRARGVRFLWLSEPQTTRTDDAFLKNLSGGGEPINTEEKGKDSVAWKAQCVLHIAANHIVKFDSRDTAIVSRMNIVEFNNQVKEEDIIPDLHSELVDHEGDEIFMWIFEGALRYANENVIKVPAIIRDRGQDHVVESSPVLRWLKEMVADGELVRLEKQVKSHMVKEKDAWAKFEQWCFDNMEPKRINKRDWLSEIYAYLGVPKHVATPTNPVKNQDKVKVVYGIGDPALMVDLGETGYGKPDGPVSWGEMLGGN